MGWSKSPPIFTSATKTIADLVDQDVKVYTPQLPYCMEVAVETPVPDASTALQVLVNGRRRSHKLRKTL
jgi:hypothetical protein